MTDRPAAELLAEWKAIPLPYAEPDVVLPRWQKFTVAHMDDVLARLARAEQDLAEAKADAWDEGIRMVESHCPGVADWQDNPYRAALRASQGGQP